MLRISDEPFDAGRELSAFETEAKGAGGIVSFTGLVRDHASSGEVRALTLQAYSPMTERGIETAMAEARERWPLMALKVIHRTGEMAPGDAIVFVATASIHRRAAFEAADFLMDYLKTEAVFWKKEATATGEHWIEPRSQDYQDRARWAKV
ncbi:molybdenum cofactor biosynthesis protein MoaE [Henriciella mobilis]|uniref:molybdenum cofactor biosynthesis protein MoaE n=1 Tax=Henriciella mobilis TaxID=2305467 RepID=UPI000E670487|nr:molybdenum cofactor biosynthesis protein MoaE [Henriciella mobilis]RIJ18305.1 molybdenum cofactor biosynthesis protein MoaE [Henriciella mobilis]RIJ24891.1 molybdenum cofactor biosynthesis protein MoaE [Henriciella mobilis]